MTNFRRIVVALSCIFILAGAQLAAGEVTMGGSVDVNLPPVAYDWDGEKGVGAYYETSLWFNSNLSPNSKVYLDLGMDNYDDDKGIYLEPSDWEIYVDRASVWVDLNQALRLRQPFSIEFEVGMFDIGPYTDNSVTWAGPEKISSWRFDDWDGKVGDLSGSAQLSLFAENWGFQFAQALNLTEFMTRFYYITGPMEFSVGYTDDLGYLFDDNSDTDFFREASLTAQATYEADIVPGVTLKVPVNGLFDLAKEETDDTWIWYSSGFNLKFDSLMLAAAAYGSVQEDYYLESTSIDVCYWPSFLEGLCIWWTGYMNPNWDPVMSGMDIGGEYWIGNIRITGGYAYLPDGSGGYDPASYGALWTDKSGVYLQFHTEF